MKRTSSVVVVVALAVLASSSTVRAQIELDGQFSGSLADTMVDLDLDQGRTARIGSGGGSSSIGPITWRVMSEVESVPIIGLNCPIPLLEFQPIAISTVVRFSQSGTLLYLVLDPDVDSYTCADPTTESFYGVSNLVAAGGTGPAAGASGTVQFLFNGTILLFDDAGADRFASFHGTFSGTITP